MWAVQSLGRLRDRESLDLLLQSLRDQSRGVRIFSARALGEIGDQRAFEGLVEALRDRKSGVEVAAAEGLVRLGDSRALQSLKDAHDRASFLTRLRLRRSLGELEARYG
jgi:HEAT repeat protein